MRIIKLTEEERHLVLLALYRYKRNTRNPILKEELGRVRDLIKYGRKEKIE